MKSYTITVNGNVYDVTVEEKGAGAAPAAPVQLQSPSGSKGSSSTGSESSTGRSGKHVKVKAGAAGKVFSIRRKCRTGW